MARRVKKKQVQQVLEDRRVAWSRARLFEALWVVLMFLFFFLAPLIFYSGLGSDGHPYFTLYNLPKSYFIVAFTLLLTAAYCASLASRPQEAAALRRFLKGSWGLRIIGFWLFWQALSLFRAPVVKASLFTLVTYLLLGLLFIVLARLFVLPNQRWAALYGLIAALVIFVPLGILQYFEFQIPLLLPIKGPASTLGYRNPAAHFMALVLPFVLFALWRHWHLWRAKAGTARLLFSLGLLLLALAVLALLFMNYSRTAIMALLAEVLVLPFIWFVVSKEQGVHGHGWKGQSLGRVLASGLLLLVVISALIMVFPESRKRVESSFKRFDQGGAAKLLEMRYYHWGNSLMMIKDNPVLGIGLGNWRFSYPLYAASFKRDPLQNYKMQVSKAHNDYLQLAAECGIPALLLFLFFWGRQFYLLRYSTRASDDDAGDWRLPLSASLLAFSVIMFFSFPMQMAYSRMFCFFLLALGEERVWPE